MANLKAKPPINVKRLTMWQMTDEENETYGEAHAYTGRLMSYRDSITSNSTKLYGDGELADVAQRVTEGTLEIGVHELSDEERTDVYGETVVNGATVTSVSDNAPYQCVAIMLERKDGTVNLKKWFKTTFAPHEENVTQLENNGVTYATPTLKGTYIPNKDGRFRAVLSGLDTTKDEAIIEKWFTQADYIGEETDETAEGTA